VFTTSDFPVSHDRQFTIYTQNINIGTKGRIAMVTQKPENWFRMPVKHFDWQ
jgi:hypothetical protein